MKSGFVALAGRPNAGKSTLLNALINEKLAIVSDKPETTRNEIRGVMNMKDAQIVFTDTPGLHPGAHLLQDRMNKEAQNVILGVDVIYLLVDGTRPFGSADEQVLQTVISAGVPVFLILNKVDRLPKEKVLKNLNSWQKRYEFAEYFPISALQQKDFHDLIETTLKYLPEGELMFPIDMVSDEPVDFRIAEIIR
ncbi:MAG: GTPase Era, partial [Erysipelotrichia bacterium]|nr:GTPase Era [Erysipelotrichia bacterium]